MISLGMPSESGDPNVVIPGNVALPFVCIVEIPTVIPIPVVNKV